MAAGQIMKTVRSVVGFNGPVYNDRLKDGQRSIKIGLGQNYAFTMATATALETAGYKVLWARSRSPQVYRLHVR